MRWVVTFKKEILKTSKAKMKRKRRRNGEWRATIDFTQENRVAKVDQEREAWYARSRGVNFELCSKRE